MTARLDHVGLDVSDYDRSKSFYEAALAPLGIRLMMEPASKTGVREIYHPHYYGAFALDPDGNNVEAVCHREPD